MKLKYLPNALGFLRIALCLPLIFLPFETMEWVSTLGIVCIVCYMVAGFTDMIDGTLARRIKGAQSQFGATLDSVADMILVIVAVVFMLPKMITDAGGNPYAFFTKDDGYIWSWFFWGYIIALLFKAGSGLVGQIKHGEMVLLHTYSNKLLAFILFIIPILYFFFGASLALNIYMVVVFVCAFIITAEEIVINLLLKKPSRDIRSVFDVKAANAATVKSETQKAETAKNDI